MRRRNYRVCLVDDNETFRAGMRFIIHTLTDWEILEEFASGELFFRMAGSAEMPDVILMDYLMPGADGIEITRKYLERFPEARVIAVSSHTSSLFHRDLIKTGFRGCIQKPNVYNQIKSVVEHVMEGGFFFHNEFKKEIEQY